MASILKVTEITTPDGTGNITVSRPLSSVQLGGVLDVNGNYVQTEKGGDITSASPLVIDTDGDYFDVTGTVSFAAMTVAADRQFTLQFDGALTMTHHATNLDLPGEANITTAAGDVAVFQSTGANTVQCIAYTKADGTPVVSAGIGTIPVLKVTIWPDQTISTGTATKVLYVTENLDSNNDFTSNTWTPSVAGSYLVIGRVTVQSLGDGDTVYLTILKNATISASVLYHTGLAADITVITAGIIEVNGSTDTIECQVTHDKGSDANLAAGIANTNMHGFKIAE